MSDVATTRGLTSARPWSFVAIALVIAAVTAWVLAGILDDGLYTVTGVLGIAAFSAGLKARREAKRAQARLWPALVAIILGGLLGSAVLVASVVYGISHLV